MKIRNNFFPLKCKPFFNALFGISVLLPVCPVLAQEDTETLDFDSLQISADSSKPERRSFETPGAVSVVGENKKFDSLDSVVRALPGTYTNIDPTQGTLNVNIRGLSGFGRVNTMVDGVPQTFYGTSSNSGSRYHEEDGNGYGPSSQFGTMIDQNFLVGVDITRGFASGAAGVNGVAGSANLRTLGVDDVVQEGRRFGILSKLSAASNGMGESNMVTLGLRTSLWETGRIGAIAGYSGSRLSANYKDGNGQQYSENDFVRRLDQRPRSWLSKFEFSPSSDHRFVVSGSGYRNNVGGRQARRDSVSLDYAFTPQSQWVNLGFLAARTKNRQVFNDDTSIWMLTEARTRNDSTYLNLHNTSYFEWRDIDVKLLYGFSHLRNRYERSASAMNQDNDTYTAFSPSGQQTLSSAYLDTTLSHGIYSLNNNLTFTRGVVRGYKPACDSAGSSGFCFPSYAANLKLVSKALNFSTMFSADLSDWFKPFVSFSRNTRIPNPQEVFFNNEGGGSMNPFLKPEQAKTWQIGFNTSREGVLTDDDYLGFKLVAYRSDIKHYIHSRSFFLRSQGGLTTDLDEDINPGFHAQIYTNAARPVRHRGVEVNLNYDAGFVFANLSYSYQKTPLPVDATGKTGLGFGTVGVTELPRHYGTLTLGGRFLDRDLALGSTFKYTGKAKRMLPMGEDLADQDELQTLPKIPIVIDVFANYQLNKHVLLKASVQNLTNRNYIDALNSLNSTLSQVGEDYRYSYSNTARGRTVFVGAEIRY
ncbi:TonB-dependent receptor domain-containing protein [Advenella mimigardefordensis]|uniref:TonB-dependent receptor Plug domain-containing protein n=1 Tax=Advenella mimigardefordensis (strain DSM 17166 / LMG 22922 / DPN7) TaxID=1247726 RepID=W0PF64_ADVMD|nr:TonB-dependent receptor [Advenella mimigardefordensis]AHG65301.1 TonB-dependent receptor Plug domain-containing protein [Advenella mimigardefordensis DPN7]